jgi:TPR repeat protein
MDRQLLQAAEKGDAASQFNLGVLYTNDFDDNHHPVEGNRAEAVRWLLAAAQQGLPRAQIRLAEIYAEAPDMAESQVKACGWYLLAAASLRGAHLHRARSGYERVCLHLTPGQIEQVRRFAHDWKPIRPNEGVTGTRGRT